MNDRIPTIIKSLLFEYESKLKNSFGNKIYGVYLYNSVALGAFDINKSDIDFITILNEEFTAKEIVRLKTIHKELNDKFKYAKRMEGMYITMDKIGKVNDDITPYVYFADNSLHDYGYYDINYVTWWTLKSNGIGINSPDINELKLDVEWTNIIDNMNYNLNKYWKGKMDKNLIFLTDYWIEFSVLTLCRILYTLENKNIISKTESAKYQMNNLPDSFRLIIQEALRIREGTSKNSLYPLRIKRLNEVKKFINYVIHYCNEKYNFLSA
ncbi:aminoglycoside adenylyltransferase domain-containing protein [Clostridium fungisolvens]|uniref:Adenylyltransferase AadA C-terminal domain-containing protein n=1 Tax=Clostridium fungisolvens TaxID=1604897 RepID=A0A6V8SH02_9CLOT|nr:aminoglycoside adenylyltransferase domain-containing protein [Clostridium fungisolvens]GFP76330.1 hypothetical protein bsdtw1_02432 [Clostridium fungisolvens]